MLLHFSPELTCTCTSCLPAVLGVQLMALSVLLLSSTLAAPSPPCASRCEHAEHCTEFSIKYGTYCGVGHTGCPGVAPCDSYDACCETHDNCVNKTSVVDGRCHAALKNCLNAALKSGAPTWLTSGKHTAPHNADPACTAQNIVETMSNGMDIASFGSLLMGGGGGEGGFLGAFGALASQKRHHPAASVFAGAHHELPPPRPRQQQGSRPTPSTHAAMLEKIAKMRAQHEVLMNRHGRRRRGRELEHQPAERAVESNDGGEVVEGGGEHAGAGRVRQHQPPRAAGPGASPEDASRELR